MRRLRKEVHGGEGGSHPTTTLSTINTHPAIEEKSDYSDAGDNELRITYGITSNSYGVLVKSTLFKGNHYSYKTTNDYHSYEPQINAIAKSVKIKS